MKKTFWKSMVCMILILCIFWGEQPKINADAAQISWSWSIGIKDHKNLVLTVSDVDREQDAKLVLINKSDDTQKYVEPFVITSETQKIGITLSENSYIQKDQYYDAYIEDEEGKISDTKNIYLSQHIFFSLNNYPYYNVHAYPNASVVENVEKYIDQKAGEKIIAKVGFKEYEGTMVDGDLIFEYPKQEIGTIINFIWKDDYGCIDSLEKEVENRNCNSYTDIEVYRDGVYIDGSLQRDQRICAVLGENIYYSEYGLQRSDKMYRCITFPTLLPEKQKDISIYIESMYGSMGSSNSYEIKNGDIWSNITAYPSMATGKISEDELLHKIKSIDVTINGVTYSGSIDVNNQFTLKYSKQKEGTILRFRIIDEAGCIDYIEKSINADELYYAEYPQIYANHLDLEIDPQTTAYVKWGNIVYSKANNTSESKEIRIDYNKQNPGTKGYFWIEAENGRESDQREIIVPQRRYIADLYAEVTYMKGLIYQDKELSATLTKEIPKAYAVIGNHKYPISLTKATQEDKDYFWYDEDDYDDYNYNDDNLDGIEIYSFELLYPKDKIGNTYQIIIEDNDGYSTIINEKFEDLEINVELDTITSESKNISGWGDIKSKVTITVGKKKYKCQADKDGYFSRKIKPQKVGTKIKVAVVSPDGYRGTVSSKIAKPLKKVKFKGNIYASKKDIIVSVNKGRKGDKIELNVGGKKYTKKIKSNKKNQTVKIPMDTQLKAGTKVTVSIKDYFGTVICKQKKTVYAASSIYVGMKENEVNYTPYGKAVEKNDYGWCKEWIYKKGATTYYVYIENGVVTEIQKYNY